jgi:hypothetical protein
MAEAVWLYRFVGEIFEMLDWIADLCCARALYSEDCSGLKLPP